MDEKHKRILTRLHNRIVHDVEIENIIDYLISANIISPSDWMSIKNKEDGRGKVREVLMLLPRDHRLCNMKGGNLACNLTFQSRGPEAFTEFRNALRKPYPWISDGMNELDSQDDTVDNASEIISPDVHRNTYSPDLPPIPSSTVTRTDKITRLREELENLEPGGYLVLHGMKGFGKSSLVATTLKDSDLVKRLFNNEVYLLKFGVEQKNPEARLSQLTRLFYRVHNSGVLSEPTNEYLLHNLKMFFKNEKHRNALLILDDVCENSVTHEFDFQCKTLVLTADINVLKGKKYSTIQMDDGFTERESLKLFADTLGIDIEKLPPQAKRIHRKCRGMPLMIAMFAAQFEDFKQDMKINPSRWNYYLDALRTRDPENQAVGEILAKLKKIFNMSIERLSVELQKCYKDLAIFVEDVSITPETLEILWDKEKNKVEDLMIDLCKKSLASREWDENSHCYIYCVHDLLLDHLRDKLTSNDVKTLHRSFVEKYLTRCHGDFSKLPKDNYIHYYIGHHLELAELYSEFPNLYLNFSFIEAKLSHAGLSDLQIDLMKYRKYITNDSNEDLVSKVKDLETFLLLQAKILAEHRGRECLDLIQIAMEHFHPGFIKQTAQELARERASSLFLRHDSPRREKVQPSLVLYKEVRIACFTDKPNQILIATNHGEIYLWNCDLHEYEPITRYQNENAIVKMIVSENDKYILSLSDDGTLKLFAIDMTEISLKLRQSSEESAKTTSPNLTQNKRVRLGNKHSDTSLQTFSFPGEKIVDMTFSKGDEMIAYCSDTGRTEVTDLHRKTLFTFNLSNCDPCCIAFTTQNKLLHIAVQSTGALNTYQYTNGKFEYSCSYNLRLNRGIIISMQCVPKEDNQLIVTTKKEVILSTWKCNDVSSATKYSRKKLADTSENVDFICSTLTFDGQYLITADTGGRVDVRNIHKGFDVIHTYSSLVTSLDTYWLEENAHMICGSGQHRLLHRWRFELEEQTAVPGSYLFDAIVDLKGKTDIIAVTTSRNTVQISQNEKIIAETDCTQGEITCLVINENGDTIVYATEYGKIHLFELKSRKALCILKLDGPPRFISLLYTGIGNMILCPEQNHLRVWENPKKSYLLENTGTVISCYLVNQKEHIITVAQGAKIKLWDRATSRLLSVLISTDNFVDINHSCLSSSEKYLTLVNKYGFMVTYGISIDDTIQPSKMELSVKMTRRFEVQSLTYCTISPNDRFLAIGCENGDILVIDYLEGKQIPKLLLHHNSIKQLYWAPPLINAPILLSLSCDEVAWWNIDLLSGGEQKKRSRTGNSKSMQNLRISESPASNRSLNKSASLEACGSKSEISHSPESGLELASIRSNSDGIDNTPVSVQWERKRAKHPRKPALLGMVGLSLNNARKVCISSDFTKFITIDNDGFIYNLCLFQNGQ